MNTSQAQVAREVSPDTLAIHGGPKTIATAPPKLVRWDDRERQQLSEMLGQPSLFYWNGPQTKLLVQRFQEHYPFTHVMPCSSGTAAIHIAIAAAGVGPGDEVITSPITDMGTVIGILYQQGVPVFADLEPNRYNLDVADVRRKITPRTKAIVAVHLTGNPCDMKSLMQLAEEHNLVVIEDCAQAWGARYRGKPIGTIGHIACYSLNDYKHISCGDGGIVASNDERFGPQLQRRGDKDYNRRDASRTCELLAPNYRISEPQSAIAAVQMTRLRAIADKREKLGRLLTERLRGIPGIQPHAHDPQDTWSVWFYMFRVNPSELTCSRADFVKALQAEGVPCNAGYIPEPVYRTKVFQNHNFFAGRWPIKELGLTSMDYRTVRCPETEAILETAVRISVTEAMDEAWIESNAKAVGKIARHYAR